MMSLNENTPTDQNKFQMQYNKKQNEIRIVEIDDTIHRNRSMQTKCGTHAVDMY